VGAKIDLEEGEMKDRSWPKLAVIMLVGIPWAFGFTAVADSVISGDFEPDNDVDWADFAVLSAAWQTHSGGVGWNHICDISDPNDGVIDMLDVLVFARHWLGTIPTGMVFVRGGEFEMGDHHDVGSPSEDPNHLVYVDSFCMDTYEVTNQQYCEFLNSALSENLIEVRTGTVVYGLDANEPYCDTYESHPLHESRILWDGDTFGVAAGKEDHPMVRVTWYGAVGYCNWRSAQDERPNCYDLATLDTNTCDFSVKGYRLPTEAEWEYAARGGLSGKLFPWGNTISHTQANYEADPCSYSYDVSPTSGNHPLWVGAYPYTSPVGFFDGTMKYKSDYNWPGSDTSYQTTNGANGYGLYDMVDNVWEWCNDRYGDDYYSWSPYYNPRGPDTGVFWSHRGGDLQHKAQICRNAHRGRNARQTKQSYGGFRTVVSF